MTAFWGSVDWRLRQRVAGFAIPARHRHRVPFWGVVGALVMRAVEDFAQGGETMPR